MDSNDNEQLAPVVLVVDDHPESVLLVTTMLEYCGYGSLQALDHA
jgi:CheY-like chemotaxis protein